MTRTIYYWIDHTARTPFTTGMQRVVRSMARALLERGESLRFVCWDDEQGAIVPATQGMLRRLPEFSGPSAELMQLPSYPASDPQPVHLSAGFDRGCGVLFVPEVTHITYQQAPRTLQVIEYAQRHDLRSAFVFYDAIPLKMEEYRATAPAHARYMQHIALADVVLPISEKSGQDLRSFLVNELLCDATTMPRIVPVPLAGEINDRPRARDYQADRSETLVLCVGTIEPRKNQAALARAFEAVCQRRPDLRLRLVMCGNLHPAVAAEIRESEKRCPAIEMRSYVDEEELADLYRRCAFTVFPSLEEGFGLPILESLWNGKPAICADFGAMREVARGGGCLMVDVRSEAVLAAAIEQLCGAPEDLRRLAAEAVARPIRTWREYADRVCAVLEPTAPAPAVAPPKPRRAAALRSPLLSICVTTYNRAAWLRVCLAQLVRLSQPYRDVVEIVVCDNASSDDTPKVVADFVDVPNLRSVRNPANVGMLGNLRVTAHEARGRHVWLLGDDDIVRPGALERVLSVLIEHPDVPLVYLNHSYTTREAPTSALEIDEFLRKATPASAPGPDMLERIAALAPLSGNFFAAICCLVFRRDHALRAYSQNTAGRPFSSLLTSIPTAHYVCTRLFDQRGYWVGMPCVTVNMNVSWRRYAPLWILERVPELHELAQAMGADSAGIDRWRVHNLSGALHWLRQMYNDDPEGNAAYFDFERFLRRHKHLPEFTAQVGEFMEVHRRARAPAGPCSASRGSDPAVTYLSGSRPPRRNALQALYWGAAGATLTPLYWLAARLLRGPGMRARWLSFRLGLRLLLARPGMVGLRGVYSLLFNPMDSTRYFELDFVLDALREDGPGRYLDVSSPRLLFTLLLLQHPRAEADLVNPDRSDLAESATLLGACGALERCRLHASFIESAPFVPGTFDVVTSISVVEHIPRDREAIAKMWQLLAPGGRLLLTLPCAARTSEQYIDRDEYGLHDAATPGWLFWQRFYDQALLEERVFSVTGAPRRVHLWGEREPGSLQANAQRKRAARFYPFWREPYMMAREYRRFERLEELPGEGVIAMEFVKP